MPRRPRYWDLPSGPRASPRCSARGTSSRSLPCPSGKARDPLRRQRRLASRRWLAWSWPTWSSSSCRWRQRVRRGSGKRPTRREGGAEAWFLSENKDFADGYGAKRSIAARGDQGDGRVTTGGAKNSACTTKGQISNRKKNPCRFRQGLEKVPTMFLKRYLQRKNRAEGFARPDARRSVEVTNRVGNLA